jgi:hypothetical protein
MDAQEQQRTRNKPGPKPDRLKIEGDPEEVIRGILSVGKPAGRYTEPSRRNGAPEKKRGKTR